MVVFFKSPPSIPNCGLRLARGHPILKLWLKSSPVADMSPLNVLVSSVEFNLSPIELWVSLTFEHLTSATDGNKTKFLRYDGELMTVYELKDKALEAALVLLATMKSTVVVAPSPKVSPLTISKVTVLPARPE